MQILICAATAFEIGAIIRNLTKNKILHKHEIDFLITGVGLTAATYHLTKHILLKKADLIIQAGVAGSLDNKIKMCDTLVIENEFIGDNGVAENKTFKSLFDLQLLKSNGKPWKDKRLQNVHKKLIKSTGLKVANGVTVNEISTSQNRIAFYKTKLNAHIETLEGAALHYVAIMENIPFLQIRTISNTAGERNKKNWKMDEAIKNLNKEVLRIINLQNL